MRARRLAYAADAITDISEIRAYLKREAGARTAKRVVTRIRRVVEQAREMPNVGIPRPEYRPNCRFAIAHPYIVYYDFDGHSLTVLRVLHHARDRDKIMGEDA